MANNTTSLDHYWEFQIIFIIWIIEFLFIGLGNGLIAFAIIRYEAIRDRKEYLIIFGLCFADFINITSYCCAGVYRTYLLQSDQFDHYKSSLSCLFTPHILGWLFMEPLAALMLVVVSVDRLIAVAMPLKYFGFSRHYAYLLLFLAYGYSIGLGMVVVTWAVMNRDDPPLVKAPCYLYQTVEAAVNQSLALYLISLTTAYGAVSVLVYVVMWLVNFRKTNITVTDQNLQEQERQFQKRVTRSVTISCLCTFAFAVVPSGLGYGLPFFSIPRVVTQLIWLLPNFNPGCNVIIFLKRQPEILEALKAIIKCKQMPIDIRLWKANAMAQHTHNAQ